METVHNVYTLKSKLNQFTCTLVKDQPYATIRFVHIGCHQLQDFRQPFPAIAGDAGDLTLNFLQLSYAL